jgi:type II secretory pathway component PulC
MKEYHLFPLLFLLFPPLLPCSLFAQTTHNNSKQQGNEEALTRDYQGTQRKLINRTEAPGLLLSLLGTVVSSDNKNNLAIILDESTSRQSLVKVGDTIHKARIQKIERTQIILLFNGNTQVLGQINRKGGGQAAETESASTVTANKPILKVLPPNIMPPPPPPAPAPPATTAKLP